jgi:hypothetical protein
VALKRKSNSWKKRKPWWEYFLNKK